MSTHGKVRLIRDGNRLTTKSRVQHHRVGPARCSCGFDAYELRGIMIDYAEEFAAHMRSVR
jgi:hypothetical protein